MSLEKASIVWSARQLSGMIKNGKINFNHIVQRSYVWERTRKSALIESMIIGYPIPPIFAKRIDDGSGKRGGNIYYIMDGKQRLSTVKEILNDEFTLSTLDPVKYFDPETDLENEIDITGKRFSELPDALRDYLYSSTFNVTYFDNLTKDEERELFKRLNAGKPLSTKSRLLASCNDIESLLNIGSHKLFVDMLTTKARDNKNQVSLVVKCWCMMNENIENISFESKIFNPMLENIVIEDDKKADLLRVFDYIFDVHSILVDQKEKKIAKKLYTETHFVSLIPCFILAIDNNISKKLMADWLSEFYDNEKASINEDYNNACSGGSAKNINITTRNTILLNSFNSFLSSNDIHIE